MTRENKKLLLIAGPCQIESLAHASMMTELILEAIDGLPLEFIYKSSYDKANRTSLSTKRGLGIDEGLQVLQTIRSQYNLPVLTDIHDREQAAIAAEVVDALQIPALLCRQTDLLLAAGRTGKQINIKKGQFLAPQDMKHVAEKVASTGNTNITLCERGTCFGYRDLVFDLRSLEIMKETGYPVIFDATHSVQSPGGENGSSGGDIRYIPTYARAAVAVGVDGLFIETHQDPTNAPSDGMSMLPVQALKELLVGLLRIREAAMG